MSIYWIFLSFVFGRMITRIGLDDDAFDMSSCVIVPGHPEIVGFSVFILGNELRMTQGKLRLSVFTVR